jgi:hypothetical protein
MSKLTDTQLIFLSAASQRDDRAVELPANGKDEAARKAIDKLIRTGLLQEVPAAGSLPVWRRDDDEGPMALRVTPSGLAAIDVGGEVVAAPFPSSCSGRRRSICSESSRLPQAEFSCCTETGR